MKKKTKGLIMIGILLIVGGYFGYKAFLLFGQYHYESNRTSNLEIKDFVMLNYYQNLGENQEYLEFKNIKIRNDFKDFEYLGDVSTDDGVKYALYDENNTLKAAIVIAVGDTYVEMLKSDMSIFGNDGVLDSNEDLKWIKTFLKENGIVSDIQLLEYVIKHQNDKSNLFTSVKKMKENYLLYYLMDMMLPDILGITIIDGTYAGYILDLGNGMKEVSILYYDKCYGFTFIGEDYFTDEYIYELLNTLVIESSTDESGKVVFSSEDEKDTFTRTYQIVDIIENNSMDYDSFEIRQFQDEETVVVEVKKEFGDFISKDKNYEFTFQRKNQDDIEDTIEAIFENTELVRVVETDKLGLEQVQEAIR